MTHQTNLATDIEDHINDAPEPTEYLKEMFAKYGTDRTKVAELKAREVIEKVARESFIAAHNGGRPVRDLQTSFDRDALIQAVAAALLETI